MNSRPASWYFVGVITHLHGQLAETSPTRIVVDCHGVGYAVFSPGPLPWTYKLLAVMLFDGVSLLWLTMIMLSAVKDYNNIVIGFAVGAILSVAGVWVLGGDYLPIIRAGGHLG